MHTSFMIDEALIERIDFITESSETPSAFARKATLERLKRMEARDKTARLQAFKKDVEMFTPIIEEVLKRLGK